MNNKILVLNGPEYDVAVAGLGEITTRVQEFVSDPTSFKLVMFTGGADVSPEFYGDTSPKNYCNSNYLRDVREIEVFNLARANNIKMTGICRGSQFLNVMCGGRMMHHVSNHATRVNHKMYTNLPDSPITVNTLHHQMSILADSAVLIGWADNVSNIYIGRDDEPEEWQAPETEAFIYPEQQVAAVQYHPEMMPLSSDGFMFYYNLVDNLLNLSMDQLVDMYGTKVKEHVS